MLLHAVTLFSCRKLAVSEAFHRADSKNMHKILKISSYAFPDTLLICSRRSLLNEIDPDENIDHSSNFHLGFFEAVSDLSTGPSETNIFA